MKRPLKIPLMVGTALVSALVVGPFLVPVRPLPGKRKPRELADADSRFLKVRGVDVHYKMAGNGRRDMPTFILLHGFLANTYSWRKVIGPLAELGTVVAFDRPGFGLTERPKAGEGEFNPYTAAAALDILAGLMDALGIESAYLVGNSAGGTVALQFALQQPGRTLGLILADPAVYVTGPPAWLVPILRSPQMRRLGPLIVRNLERAGSRMGRAAWYDPGRFTPEQWSGYLKPLEVEDWDFALWEFVLAYEPPDLKGRLNEVRQPVLVITGDTDRIVPATQSARLAEELPDAEIVIVPKCGHMPQEEQPEAFLSAVTEFVGRLSTIQNT